MTVAPSTNPHRTNLAPVPREPDPRDEEDLGAWVRLPGGGLELRD